MPYLRRHTWQDSHGRAKGVGMLLQVRKVITGISIAVSLTVFAQLPLAHASKFISPDVIELGLSFRENAELGRMPSMLTAIPDQSDQSTFRICKDVDDQLCKEATRVSAFANLSPCLPNSQLSCIESVWAVDASGKKILGEFVKDAGVNPNYINPEIPSMNYPRSAGIGSIWKIPGVLNASGLDTYFVGTQISGGLSKAAGVSLRDSKFNFESPVSGIMPVQEIAGPVRLLFATDVTNNPDGFGTSGVQKLQDGTVCAATEVGICYAIRQFPQGYRFGMAVRLSTKVSGWFHGRMYLPSISFKDSSVGTEISIEAEPVKIPSLDFAVPNAELPQSVRDFIFNGGQWGTIGNGTLRTQIAEDLDGPRSIDLISIFAPVYKDKATSEETYWSFKALKKYSSGGNLDKCSAKDGTLAGLVTTNALTYSAGPPSYDVNTGTLNYKVASPHFESDGKVVASGSYDLALRSEVARCIYGFSQAPISAEISITSPDGERKVATTVVNERNGWLYLSAKGFTFSAPVINVKLTQEVPAVVATPTPSATSIAAKKVVKITCAKGSKKKNVSGVKPICPKGYKLSK